MKTLTREKGLRMWGGGGSVTNGAGSSGGGDGVAASWVEQNYVSKAFWSSIFQLRGTKTTTVGSGTPTVESYVFAPNELPATVTTETDGATTTVVTAITDIKVLGGLWTESYLSALGQGSGGGGGGGASALTDLLDVAISNPTNGQVLMYNSTTNKWYNGTVQSGGGSVTSITAGTGLSGGTITSSGTIAISSTYQTYISNGNTAYGWGNHANAGYLTSSDISDMATKTWVGQQGFVTSSGVTSVSTGTGLTGGPITGSGTISINSTYQTYISNGNTAYGWGNHANAGYLTSSDISDMATKTWVGQQGFVTSSGVTSVSTGTGLTGGPITGSGTISINSTYQTYISNGNTAYGWGNHANAGYLTGITSSMVTSALGYTPLSNATTFWGQTVSNGVVTGIMTFPQGKFALANSYSDTWEDSNGNKHPWYGYDHRSHNTGVFSTTITDYHGLTLRTGSGILSMTSDTGYVGIGTYSPSFKLDVNGNAKVGTGSDGDYLQIGNIRLIYNYSNNAIYIQGSTGTAANLYATGGVSALGFSAGTSSVDSMKFGYLTVNNRLYLTNSDGDGGSIYSNSNGDLIISADNDNIRLSGDIYTNAYRIYTNGGNIYTAGGYIYLASGKYLYVSGTSLYFYNGSTTIQIA